MDVTVPRLLRALLGFSLASTVVAGGVLVPAAPAAAADYMHPSVSQAQVVVPMIFPVIGRVSYSDSYNAVRFGGARPHYAQDLMGTKMEPLVAAFDATVVSVQRETQVGGGNYIALRGMNKAAGWAICYLHVNNDTPGTDDGKGTANWSFTPGIKEGVTVFAGQQIGWLGDSGNAESTAPHLHFELWRYQPWSGTVYNPLASLNVARHLATPVRSGPHPDGALIQNGFTGPYYVIENARKRPMSAAMFAMYGWTPSQVFHVSVGELYSYPVGVWLAPRAGSVVADPLDVTHQRWLVADGTRVAVDEPTLSSLGMSNVPVKLVPTVDLARLPVVAGGTPALGVWHSGALVRIGTDPQVWAFAAGERHAVPDARTMANQNWTSADVASIAPPADPTTLPPVGAPVLLRDGTVMVKPGYYGVVSGGKAHAAPNQMWQQLFGYQLQPKVVVNSADIQRMGNGPRMY